MTMTIVAAWISKKKVDTISDLLDTISDILSNMIMTPEKRVK